MACRSLWYPGNRSSLSPAELTTLQADARVRCLGHVADVRALYAASDLVVLPF